MIDWATLAFKFLGSTAEAAKQGLENAGQKIPMREEAIRAKAKYRAEKFEWKTDIKVFEAKQIRKWKADFMINADKFSLIQEGAVKNMIERLVSSGKVIYKIELRTKRHPTSDSINPDRYYACIRYVDNDDCETWIELEGKRVRD